MIDETTGAGPEDAPMEPQPGAETPPSDAAPSDAAAAWRAVVAELDTLGDAIGRWLKAAAGDPENKRRVDELGSRLEGFADQVGSTLKDAAETEIGRSFKEAADKTGEALKQAGEKLSDEVGPKLAGAFRSIGEHLRTAAERIEDRAGADAATGADAPASEPTESVATDDPADPHQA
jgi:hypothetical protein